MFETRQARSTGRRRLVAACTAGIMSLGAFALGTSAQAAEPGGHHRVTKPTAPAVQLPHTGSLRAPAKSPFTAKTTTTALQAPAPLRYDVDADGVGDQLIRQNNGDWYNSLADSEQNLGAGDAAVHFADVLTPGDLDSSTGPDVLGLTADGVLQLFGSGNFPNYASWAGHGWNVYNKVVAVDDLNGDGRADLLARTFDGHLYLYTGTGNGSAPFAPRVLIGGGWAGYDQLTSPGDVNGDGVSDLVARDTAGTLYIYYGTGSAAAPYAPRVLVGNGWGAYNQIIGLGNNSSGSGSLWARAYNGQLYGYYPNGAGLFAPRSGGSTGFQVLELMAGMGSVPAWGKKQLIGETAGGTLFWYYPDNAGNFYPRQQISPTGDWQGYSNFTLADALSNDGEASLLLRDGTTLYNIDLDGAVISTGWSSYTSVVGPGDLSGDGRSDLVARDSSGHLYLYRGNGNGVSLAGRQLIGSGWNTYNALVGAGDMTGDGRADLVARDTAGGLWLYKGTGNTSAPFSARIKLGTGYQQYNKLASAGDIDGDGRADLLAVNSSTGTLYRYTAYGTGQLKARVALGTGWNGYSKLF